MCSSALLHMAILYLLGLHSPCSVQKRGLLWLQWGLFAPPYPVPIRHWMALFHAYMHCTEWPCYVTVVCCYAGMFTSFYRSRKHVGQSMTRETSISKRIFSIVLTDAACWIPVICIKILALSGTAISPTVYGWVAILVLPINSAINPFLYSISTPTVRGHLASRVSTWITRAQPNLTG